MWNAVRSAVLTGAHRASSAAAAMCECSGGGGTHLLRSAPKDVYQIRFPAHGQPPTSTTQRITKLATR